MSRPQCLVAAMVREILNVVHGLVSDEEYKHAEAKHKPQMWTREMSEPYRAHLTWIQTVFSLFKHSGKPFSHELLAFVIMRCMAMLLNLGVEVRVTRPRLETEDTDDKKYYFYVRHPRHTNDETLNIVMFYHARYIELGVRMSRQRLGSNETSNLFYAKGSDHKFPCTLGLSPYPAVGHKNMWDIFRVWVQWRNASERRWNAVKRSQSQKVAC